MKLLTKLPKLARPLLATALLCACACNAEETANDSTQSNQKPPINPREFQEISQEALELRQERLVSLDEFLALSKQKGVIILDSRSASAYASAHLAGAIHLNFSDFTEPKLSKLIPSKETKILIYCNNNFRAENPSELESMELVGKWAGLALNLPTFINLVGYGYENVYELGEYLDVNDKRLTWSNTILQK